MPFAFCFASFFCFELASDFIFDRFPNFPINLFLPEGHWGKNWILIFKESLDFQDTLGKGGLICKLGWVVFWVLFDSLGCVRHFVKYLAYITNIVCRRFQFFEFSPFRYLFPNCSSACFAVSKVLLIPFRFLSGNKNYVKYAHFKWYYPEHLIWPINLSSSREPRKSIGKTRGALFFCNILFFFPRIFWCPTGLPKVHLICVFKSPCRIL